MERRTDEVARSGFTDHVLVCTNDRDSEHACCADAGGEAVYDAVASWLRERGVLWSRVHLAETSCLANCSDAGAAVTVYPRGEWFAEVSPDDVPDLLAEVFGTDASDLGVGVDAD